jgi:hypothetical protein
VLTLTIPCTAASVKGMPQVARFAQAGMFDMARATDLLTDAQSFAREGKPSAHYLFNPKKKLIAPASARAP